MVVRRPITLTARPLTSIGALEVVVDRLALGLPATRPAPRRAADTDFAGAGAPTAETGVGSPSGRLTVASQGSGTRASLAHAGLASPRRAGVDPLTDWTEAEKREAFGR